MTFFNAPLAIDGANISSALFRRAQYNAMSGAEGVTEATDLKVTQLAVPGNGLLIAPGNVTVLNRYQTTVNEVYSVSNAGSHEVLSTEMPTSQPTDKSYLVLVSIGDPEFSQVGHPWMTSAVLDPVTEAPDYVYVRPWILEVAPGTTDFGSLGLDYPAYALARLDIPASTTTITNAMITDLRRLARPRTKTEIILAYGNVVNLTTYATWMRFPNVPVGTIAIPSWATTAKIMGAIEGVRALATDASPRAIYRPYIEGTAKVGFETNGYESNVTNLDRFSYTLAGSIDVSDIAGTSKVFSVEARGYDAGDVSKFSTDGATSVQMMVYFEEAPI